MFGKLVRIVLATGIMLFAVMFVCPIDFGIAHVTSQADSNVSATTVSTGDTVYHPDPFVVIEVETDALDEHLLLRELKEALSEVAQLTTLDPEHAPEDAPVLYVRLTRVTGFFTPLFSRNDLEVRWYYAGDGDIERYVEEGTSVGLDQGEAHAVRWVTGDTQIGSVMYGVFTRVHHLRRLARQVGDELASQLAP